jgi:hypothetical protein
MIYCLAETREESEEHSISFIISISEGVLLFAMFVIGMIYLGKHGKLNKILFWRGDASTLDTSDTEQQASLVAKSPSKQ